MSLRVLRTTSRHFEARERGTSGSCMIQFLGKTCGLHGKKELGAKETKEYFQVIQEGTFCWYFWRSSCKSLQAGGVIRTLGRLLGGRGHSQNDNMNFWLVKGVHCPDLGTASKLTVHRHHQPPLKTPQGVEDQFYDFNVRLRCFFFTFP